MFRKKIIFFLILIISPYLLLAYSEKHVCEVCGGMGILKCGYCSGGVRWWLSVELIKQPVKWKDVPIAMEAEISVAGLVTETAGIWLNIIFLQNKKPNPIVIPVQLAMDVELLHVLLVETVTMERADRFAINV